MAWHLIGARPSATIMMTLANWCISGVANMMGHFLYTKIPSWQQRHSHCTDYMILTVENHLISTYLIHKVTLKGVFVSSVTLEDVFCQFRVWSLCSTHCHWCVICNILLYWVWLIHVLYVITCYIGCGFHYFVVPISVLLLQKQSDLWY